MLYMVNYEKNEEIIMHGENQGVCQLCTVCQKENCAKYTVLHSGKIGSFLIELLLLPANFINDMILSVMAIVTDGNNDLSLFDYIPRSYQKGFYDYAKSLSSGRVKIDEDLSKSVAVGVEKYFDGLDDEEYRNLPLLKRYFTSSNDVATALIFVYIATILQFDKEGGTVTDAIDGWRDFIDAQDEAMLHIPNQLPALLGYIRLGYNQKIDKADFLEFCRHYYGREAEKLTLATAVGAWKTNILPYEAFYSDDETEVSSYVEECLALIHEHQDARKKVYNEFYNADSIIELVMEMYFSLGKMKAQVNICENCGLPFVSYSRGNQKYCSRETVQFGKCRRSFHRTELETLRNDSYRRFRRNVYQRVYGMAKAELITNEQHGAFVAKYKATYKVIRQCDDDSRREQLIKDNEGWLEHCCTLEGLKNELL